MAFEDLKKKELEAIADYYGTDSDGNKSDIVERLGDDGVSWEDFEAHRDFIFPPDPEPVDEPEPEEVAPVEEPTVEVPEVEPEVQQVEEPADAELAKDEGLVLVKMTRINRVYEIAGKRFTRSHPFILVDRATADKILEKDGFREASHKEAEEYYS